MYTNSAAPAKVKKPISKNTKIVLICIVAILVIAVITGAGIHIAKPLIRYNKAISLYDDGKYSEALEIMESMGDYKNSGEYIKKIKYKAAKEYYDKGDYRSSISNYEELGSYENSEELLKEARYKYAAECMEKYPNLASEQYEKLGDYKDSKQKLKECYKSCAQKKFDEKDYSMALWYYEKIENYDKNDMLYKGCNYYLGVEAYNRGYDYKEAVDLLREAFGYNDNVRSFYYKAMYAYVKKHYTKTDKTTFEYLLVLSSENYADSISLIDKLYEMKADIYAVNISQYSEEDFYGKLTTLDTIYFHYRITGGYPDGESNTITLKIIYPDKHKETKTVNNVTDGYSGYLYWANGIRGNSQGILTVKIYYASKKIGERSIYVYK